MVILGVPLTYSDKEVKSCIYDSVMNRNEDLRVPIAPKFNSSDVYAPIQPQFIERIYIY